MYTKTLDYWTSCFSHLIFIIIFFWFCFVLKFADESEWYWYQNLSIEIQVKWSHIRSPITIHTLKHVLYKHKNSKWKTKQKQRQRDSENFEWKKNTQTRVTRFTNESNFNHSWYVMICSHRFSIKVLIQKSANTPLCYHDSRWFLSERCCKSVYKNASFIWEAF